MLPIFAPKLSTWLWVIVLSVCVSAVFLHFREDSQTRERLEHVTKERDDAKRSLERANQAVSACMSVNLENAQARDRENQRAKDAEARTAEAEHEADIAIQIMQDRIAQLRNRNLDCPAIDSDFRDWLQDNP